MSEKGDVLQAAAMRLRRSGVVLPLAGAALLSACNSGQEPPRTVHSSVSSPSPKGETPPSPVEPEDIGMPVVRTIVPDLSWFCASKPEVRPCIAQLRATPEVRQDNILTMDPANPRARYTFPLESFGGKSGTPLEAVCQFDAQRVVSTNGSSSTKKWYVVRVALSKLLNPDIPKEGEDQGVPFLIQHNSRGERTGDVFMSAAWAEGQGSIVLPQCNSRELPAEG